MRVLAVSDVVNPKLYSPYVKDIIGEIDLIISCGDLPVYYLDYLVTMLGKPLFYICGNHDHYKKEVGDKYLLTGFQKFYREEEEYLNSQSYFGGTNMDKKIEKYHHLLFMGLEGCKLYNYEEHQYTEKQMKNRINRMRPILQWNRMFNGRSLDVLITHAPPRGIHDLEDIPHQGFEVYLDFIKKYKPKYLLHGHTHLYDYHEKRCNDYYGTKVINCYDYQIIDL